MAKLATILFVSVALLLLLLPNGVVGSGGRSRPPGSSRPSRRNRLHRGSTGDDSPLEDGSQPSDDGPGGFDGTPDLSLVYAFTTGRGQKTRIDDDPSDARHDPSAPGAIPPNLDGGAPSLRRQGGFRHRSRPAGPQQEGGQQEPRTSPRGHQLNRRPAFRRFPGTEDGTFPSAQGDETQEPRLRIPSARDDAVHPVTGFRFPSARGRDDGGPPEDDGGALPSARGDAEAAGSAVGGGAIPRRPQRPATQNTDPNAPPPYTPEERFVAPRPPPAWSPPGYDRPPRGGTPPPVYNERDPNPTIN